MEEKNIDEMIKRPDIDEAWLLTRGWKYYEDRKIYSYLDACYIARFLDNDDSKSKTFDPLKNINNYIADNNLTYNPGDVIIRDFFEVNESYDYKIREIRPITEADLIRNDNVEK